MKDSYTAFDLTKKIGQGTLGDVVLKAKRRLVKTDDAKILIFSDATGKSMDFNLQGTEAEVLKRLEIYVAGEDSAPIAGPGRPKLGVVSREVSLLPRHWEWLATQPGGASSTLRKLVEEAKRKNSTGSEIKQAQERAYKFMQAVAGDFEGYEEALRALYRKDKKEFKARIQKWPEDVREYASALAKDAFYLPARPA